jgi:hypothetical protein
VGFKTLLGIEEKGGSPQFSRLPRVPAGFLRIKMENIRDADWALFINSA